MIEIVEHDVLDGPEFVVLHGCNAQGKFNKGIAKAIRERYPGAYHAYMNRFEKRGLRLGEVIYWKSDDRIILNGITQRYYSNKPGVRSVDYDAVRSVMRWVEAQAARHIAEGQGVFVDHPVIAMPKIGAGLAGGDWGVIEQIICEEIRSIPFVVYDLPKQPQPGRRF